MARRLGQQRNHGSVPGPVQHGDRVAGDEPPRVVQPFRHGLVPAPGDLGEHREQQSPPPAVLLLGQVLHEAVHGDVAKGGEQLHGPRRVGLAIGLSVGHRHQLAQHVG